MNLSFSAYTPRVRPLDYDSLRAKVGCEPDSGNDHLGVLAFNLVCIAEFDADDYGHAQPDDVAYAQGPDASGEATKPFLTRWAAWVATAGVRVGKASLVIPPAATEGDASALYPTAKPTKLSLAFDRSGLLAIAIQKTATTIELKQYTDTAGAVATHSWDGFSAVLFNAGLLARYEPPQGGVVAYYLRTANPNVVYARFADEEWATERVIMPDVRVALARLVGCAVGADMKAELRAIDADGRAVTLYSPQYSATASDAATIGTALEGGTYHDIGVPAPDQSDKSTLAISFASGLYFDATVEPSNQPDQEKATVSVEFDSGEYTKIT